MVAGLNLQLGFVRTQNMAIGLNLCLGSQSICIVGVGFPTTGDPLLGNLSALLFTQTPLFTSQSRSFSISEWFLFSLNVLPRIANPILLILVSYL